MADEIAQVCELEIRGITMAVKAPVELAQLLGRLALTLLRLGNEHAEKKEKKKEKKEEKKEKKETKKLNEPGEKSVEEIFKLSRNGPPQVVNLRKEDMEEILQLAQKDGLHWASTVDFIPGDGLTPVLVPPQEAAIWDAIIEKIASKRLEKDKKTVAEYDRQLAEEKEKLRNVMPEDKAAIETRIENLLQAKAEAEKWVAYGEDVVTNKSAAISFVDYLRLAKGTEFEKNPERAMAEYEKGVEPGRKMPAKECFSPIRDKSYMPDTQLTFYFPDHGAIVTRKFEVDQETGLVYSEYALKTESGEIHQFSDRNMTKDQWNSNVLPKMLDQAGMIEGTECRLFDSQEKLQAYMDYHGKVRPQSEINVENAIKEGKAVFHSAEAKNEIETAVSEKAKGFASAKIESDRMKISVDPEHLSRYKGKLRLRLNENEDLYFTNIANEGIKDGKAVFEIENNATVLYVKHEGNEIKQSRAMTAGEFSKKILEAASKDQVMSQHKNR